MTILRFLDILTVVLAAIYCWRHWPSARHIGIAILVAIFVIFVLLPFGLPRLGVSG